MYEHREVRRIFDEVNKFLMEHEAFTEASSFRVFASTYLEDVRELQERHDLLLELLEAVDPEPCPFCESERETPCKFLGGCAPHSAWRIRRALRTRYEERSKDV